MRADKGNRESRGRRLISFIVSFRKKIFCVSLVILTIFLILNYVLPSLLNDSKAGRKKETAISDKSLLVLPFKNMNINSDDQYFVDGISENIINSFFMIRELKVIPGSTTEHFGKASLNSSDIAGALKVRYLLEGNVHRDQNEVKIIVELLDISKNKHIMSEKFEGNVSEIFILQSEIVKMVAEKVGIVPTYDDIQLIEKIPTQVSEAYDYYLKARFLFNNTGFVRQTESDPESLESSLSFYQKAASADTTFAGAWAGIANVWFALASRDRSGQYEEKINMARVCTDRALEIDPYCAEAHAVRGSCMVWPDRNFEGGKFELLITRQLNPNYPIGDLQYIQLLLITGPVEKARLYINQAIDREPYSWILHNLNAWIYYFEENNTKSIDACKVAYEFNPDYIFNNWLFFLNYAKTGDGEAAVNELQVIARKAYESDIYDNKIREAFNKSGIDGLFLWIIDMNISKPNKTTGLNGDPFFLSWWFALLGEREKSLGYLEKSLNNTGDFTYSNSISANPDFDILRDDPRFSAIMDKLGLSQYNYRRAKTNFHNTEISK